MTKVLWLLKLVFPIVCLAPSLWLVFSVAPNDDEFIHYKQIAYFFYPGNRLYQPCFPFSDSSALELFGIQLPLRSYLYVGSLPSLLYFPFFALWQNLYSARLMGILSLSAIFFLSKKLWRLNSWMIAVYVFYCFPLVFQLIIDTGPVGFQLVAAFALPLFATYRLNWKFSLLWGLALFAAFWNKGIFLTTIPFMATLFAYCLWNANRSFTDLAWRIKSCISRLVPGVLAFAIMSTLLLMARNADGMTYFAVLKQTSQLHFSNAIFREDLFSYFKNFLQFSHRVYQTPQGINIASLLFLSVLIVLVLCPFFRLDLNKGEKLWPLFFILSSFCSFFIIASMPNAWAGHHLILAFPGILCAIFSSLSLFKESSIRSRWLVRSLCIIAFLSQVTLFATVTKDRVRGECHPSIIEINNYLNSEQMANRYAYIVVDWGMLFIQTLYGPKNQSVIKQVPFRDKDVPLTREKLKILNRMPLFIGRRNSPNMRAAMAAFPEVKFDSRFSPAHSEWVIAY